MDRPIHRSAGEERRLQAGNNNTNKGKEERQIYSTQPATNHSRLRRRQGLQLPFLVGSNHSPLRRRLGLQLPYLHAGPCLS